MSILLAAVAAFSGGSLLDAISANWADIAAASPTSSAANSNQTLSWSVGGSRSIACDYTGGNVLSYRIDSGTYTEYTGAFTVTSGQTVNWRVSSITVDEVVTVTVTDVSRGSPIDSFTVSTAGYGE